MAVSPKQSLLSISLFFFLLWILLPTLWPKSAQAIYLLTLPFRLVGVLVHELGHGLGSAISGGHFYWFQLEGIQGGLAVTAGGSRVLSLLTGLLGPASYGALLLAASVRPKYQTWAFLSLVIMFLLSAFYIMRPLFLMVSHPEVLEEWSITYLFGLILPFSMLVLLFLCKVFGALSQRLIVQTLAVVLCFSAFSDTHYIFLYPPIGEGLYSDTRTLAGLLFGGPEHVGMLLFWVVAACVAMLNFAILGKGLAWCLRQE